MISQSKPPDQTHVPLYNFASLKEIIRQVKSVGKRTDRSVKLLGSMNTVQYRSPSSSHRLICTTRRSAVNASVSSDRSPEAITSMDLPASPHFIEIVLDIYVSVFSTSLRIWCLERRSLDPSCPRRCALARSSTYRLPQRDMLLLPTHHDNRKALRMPLLAMLRQDFMLLLSSTSPDPLHQHHHTPPAEIL